MTRFKRMLAFIIDWNLIMLPLAAVFFVLIPPMTQYPDSAPLLLPLLVALMILFFGIFMFRDSIFGTRSLGKKLFGLRIIDKESCTIATRDQRIVKNLLAFVYPIDAVFLLLFGRTFGNMISKTNVVSNIEF